MRGDPDVSPGGHGRARRAWVLVGLLVAVAGVAVAVGLTRSPRPHFVAIRARPTLPSLPAVVGTAPTTSSAAPRLHAPVDAAQLTAARRTAQAFLAGYLSYLYGHARASRLTHLTPGLRAQLAGQPPRVTPAQRTRHPRLLALAAVGQTPDTVLVTATVADGGAPPYPIRLSLVRQAGGWVVTAIPA
jgi:hypothetical protein